MLTRADQKRTERMDDHGRRWLTEAQRREDVRNLLVLPEEPVPDQGTARGFIALAIITLVVLAALVALFSS